MLKNASGLAALVMLVGLSGTGHASVGQKDRRDDVVVSCTSTVRYDSGGCARPARKKCGGEVRLAGVLASTRLADSGLHAITARYRCVGKPGSVRASE